MIKETACAGFKPLIGGKKPFPPRMPPLLLPARFNDYSATLWRVSSSRRAHKKTKRNKTEPHFVRDFSKIRVKSNVSDFNVERLFLAFWTQVKLVNIRNDDITDGNPKLTLGLIWTIILHFQVSALIEVVEVVKFVSHISHLLLSPDLFPFIAGYYFLKTGKTDVTVHTVSLL